LSKIKPYQNSFYKLSGKQIAQCAPFNLQNQQLFLTKMGGIHVSTIFLGVSHGFTADDEPILFETMISGGEHGGSTFRYTDWDSARVGHDSCVEKAREEAILCMIAKNRMTREEAIDSIKTQELLEV
jgi:hypothetical protein